MQLPVLNMVIIKIETELELGYFDIMIMQLSGHIKWAEFNTSSDSSENRI